MRKRLRNGSWMKVFTGEIEAGLMKNRLRNGRWIKFFSI
jgi:hypothetical protein